MVSIQLSLVTVELSHQTSCEKSLVRQFDHNPTFKRLKKNICVGWMFMLDMFYLGYTHVTWTFPFKKWWQTCDKWDPSGNCNTSPTWKQTLGAIPHRTTIYSDVLEHKKSWILPKITPFLVESTFFFFNSQPLPSGKLPVCYWKLPKMTVDLRIENGDSL